MQSLLKQCDLGSVFTLMGGEVFIRKKAKVDRYELPYNLEVQTQLVDDEYDKFWFSLGRELLRSISRNPRVTTIYFLQVNLVII